MKAIIASSFIALGLLLSANVQAATPVISGQSSATVGAATGTIKPAKKNKRVKRVARKAVVTK
ncbi:MAG: hypothetical protein RLZZ612_278 [Pseudomonadota bacterium]|jgi:hypothetical protein